MPEDRGGEEVGRAATLLRTAGIFAGIPGVRGLVLLLAACAVPEAAACGLCMWALCWTIMPAVIPWSILSAGWFLINSSAATFGRFTSFTAPNLIIALGLVVAGYVVGMVGFGPVTILPFGMLALASFAASWMQTGQGEERRWCLWVVRCMGFVVVALFFTTGVIEQRKFNGMDEADKFLKWSGTAVGHTLLYQWKQNEPASLPYYRKVVARGDSWGAATAAQRIGEIGSATEDVPLMIGAMGRMDGDPIWREDVEEAVERLSGVDMPKNTSVADWQQAWAAKAAVPGATP